MRLGMSLALNGRRGGAPTPTQMLLSSATFDYRPAPGPTMPDRRGGAPATLTDTSFVAAGATWVDSTAATRTAAQDCIVLNGTSAKIVLPANPMPITTTGAASRVVVFRAYRADGFDRIYDDQAASKGLTIQFGAASSVLSGFVYKAASNTNYGPASTGYSPGNVSLATSVRDGTSLKVSVNNSVSAGTTMATTETSAAAPTVGSTVPGGSYLEAEILAVIGWDDYALTSDDRALLRAEFGVS